jgi:Rrf2 family nitric oxide-sensitive transcriptional repressor
MKVTTKTDLCLRALIYLQERKEKVKIKEISNHYKVSKNHMSVAINLLSELGYVNSTSGPNGGIEFNQKFEDKSVGELIEKIEDFDIVECFNSKTNTCTISKNCKLKKMLMSSTNAFLKELRKYKIKDLV